MRNCQPGPYCAGAGRRVAEADRRHVTVSDRPTTDIRETCTYQATAELEYGADVTAPTLTGPVPGPLWPAEYGTVSSEMVQSAPSPRTIGPSPIQSGCESKSESEPIRSVNRLVNV